MEFYIKKGATLPTLKYKVVKDGRSDYHRFYNYVNTDSLYFSMVDYQTKIPKVTSRKAKFVQSEIDGEYYAVYQLKNRDTNDIGRYEGSFLIKTNEGIISLNLKEKIYINVVESILPDLLEGGGCYTSDNPCCPVPSFTPTKSLSNTPTPTLTQTPTTTSTPTLTPTPTVGTITIILDGGYAGGSINAYYTATANIPVSIDIDISFIDILSVVSGSPVVISGSVSILSGQTSGSSFYSVSGDYNLLTEINNFSAVTVSYSGFSPNQFVVNTSSQFNVTPTPSNTPTSSIIPSSTPTLTPTNTPTNTETLTPTQTPTNTETPTQTPTNTETPTQTPTNTETPTQTNTETPTQTPTNTETPTPTQTPTNTETPTPTQTPTNTSTPTPTPIPNLLISLDSGNINSYPTTGNTWFDLQSGDNNSTLINNPTFSTGYTGILSFDSNSSQYATINDIGDLNQWTIEVWFRLSTSLTGIVSSLVTNQYNGGSKLNFSIGTNNSPITYNLVVGFFDGSWHNTSGFVPVVGDWYQVVGTYDGSVIRQYINGVASGGTVNYVGTPQSGGEIRLMRRWDSSVGPSNLIDGDLAIVKIYNTALTSGQILQNYNDNSSRFT